MMWIASSWPLVVISPTFAPCAGSSRSCRPSSRASAPRCPCRTARTRARGAPPRPSSREHAFGEIRRRGGGLRRGDRAVLGQDHAIGERAADIDADEKTCHLRGSAGVRAGWVVYFWLLARTRYTAPASCSSEPYRLLIQANDVFGIKHPKMQEFHIFTNYEGPEPYVHVTFGELVMQDGGEDT